MKNLIVPCAGDSFLDGVPKCISRHPDGKILVEKCIEGIKPNNFDRIIISVLEIHEDQFNIKSTILNTEIAKLYSLEICIISEKTIGPADTVYQTICNMNVQGSILIKDVDNYLAIDTCEHLNFVAGIDVFDFKKNIPNLCSNSFMVVNEQHHILDIFEKQLKSNIICLGLYGFKDANDFKDVYELLIDPIYDIKKLYVSHIISYLIGRKTKIFSWIRVTDYENYGTEKEWFDIKKKYALYYVPFELLCSNEVWNHKVVDSLQNLIAFGAKLVLTTRDSSICKNRIQSELQKLDIIPFEIICECAEPLQIVISNESDLAANLAIIEYTKEIYEKK